ncbi:hypothetical protein BU25DRAFT_410972 [Macroventuria anomochaeta]|uniref:Uncharacterized protein n=1 Tax=Macroventuria anomochaeta TaxID=301207 RepID=A0ACB6S1I7_9PLEO|nr:uncharacterized protein BU25DRAFT_410972 [Macroventuria anomochaeta]KAF2627372.1 hypothetical protein BU25DRAFT_410972 [Macroventuria anomochaeta]
MGRTEKSQGLAPPAIRKDIRAKQARHIINKVVPAILASNARARRGADGSGLIVDPGPASSNEVKKLDEGGEDVAYVKRKGQGRRKAKSGHEFDDEDTAPPKIKVKKSGKRRNDSIDEDLSTSTLHVPAADPASPKQRTIKVVTTDSLTAAQILSSISNKPTKKSSNVCILNMASPLRPGGGVLAGATSQEEFLCARTTLLPSLKEPFYRLPEYGGIYTPDVLVFRTPGPLGDSHGELGAGERYYVDVISAGMLRFPDLEGEEDEMKRLGKRDRDVAERKMRAVLRIAEAKGVKKLVLGAWGCGAYGNPVVDVAEAWNRVLSGTLTVGGKKGKMAVNETWPNLENVLFAISNHKMAKEFARAFGGGVEAEDGPRSFDEDDEEEDEKDRAAQELRTKIEEMESQISKVWNVDLKSRLGVVLDGLKAQLRERQGEEDGSDEGGVESGEDEDDSDEHDELAGGSDDGSNEDAGDLNTFSDGVDSSVDSGVVVKS